MQAGNLVRAEMLYEECLALMEAHGGNVPAIAGYHSSLASINKYLGRTTKAEPHYRAAVDVYEKAMGKEHIDVVPPIEELADFLHNTGVEEEESSTMARYLGEAEALYRRAVHIREISLGAEDASVTETLLSLGNNLKQQEKYAESVSVLRRSLTGFEATHGPDHVITAQAAHDVAKVMHLAGELEESETLFRRVLKLAEGHLGPNHPELVAPLMNFALLLRQTGRVAEAEELEKRAAALVN
jgi:tetratricopeptide (TPR) repeat protein